MDILRNWKNGFKSWVQSFSWHTAHRESRTREEYEEALGKLPVYTAKDVRALEQASAAILGFDSTTSKLVECTTFAIRTAGRDYLVTNWHVTNHEGNGTSRAFTLDGTHYFLIAKGRELAVARQMVANALGASCGTTEPLISKDVSLLQMLPPADAAVILQRLQSSPATQEKVQRTLEKNRFDTPLTGEALTRALHSFQLTPIALNENDTPLIQGTKISYMAPGTTYTISFRDRAPVLTLGSILKTRSSIHELSADHNDSNGPFMANSGSPMAMYLPGRFATVGILRGYAPDRKEMGFSMIENALEGIKALDTGHARKVERFADLCVNGAITDTWIDHRTPNPGQLPVAPRAASTVAR